MSDRDASGDAGVPNKSNSHQQIFYGRGSESNVSLRGPWVPAPAKTTLSTSFIGDGNRMNENETRNNKSPEVAATQGSSQSNRSFLTPKKKYRRRARRSGGREVSLAGYTLKTKDSLVDVAACLNERREEVLKLWEKNLPEGEAGLLGDLERANKLALEAATEVDQLRKSIQEIKKRPDASPRSTDELEDMRTRIISKLEMFEEAHSSIQQRLRRVKESASQTNRKSSRSISRSPHTGRSYGTSTSTPDNKNMSSLVVLKDKPNVFSQDTDNENVNELDLDCSCLSKIGSKSLLKTKSKELVIPTKSKRFDSAEDLSKLYHLYTRQKFTLSPLQEMVEGTSEEKLNDKSGVNVQLDGLKGQKYYYEDIDDRGRESFTEYRPSTCIYRDKIHGLHEKLLEQETKTEELTREMQRIESQSGFDLRMLKSRIRERLDELEHLPELLQLTERRLTESIQGRQALETKLQLKTQELTLLKKEMEKLGGELENGKREWSTHGQQIQSLIAHKAELESANNGLRNELQNAKEQIRRLREKLSEKVPGKPRSRGSNVLMEDRLVEMQRELTKEKKRSSILKQAKDNLAVEMTRREEEVLESLEESRRRNRSLQSQLNFIKSSYHSIFPDHLLHLLPNDADDSPKLEKAE